VITFIIPGMRLVNLANDHTHWRNRQKRARIQRIVACYAACGYDVHQVTPPVVVTITRMGKGTLDSDGAVISAKHVRDGIADALGVDDGDPRVTWVVKQERAKEWAVRVEIECPEQASGREVSNEAATRVTGARA
jgi:hypothetical protein